MFISVKTIYNKIVINDSLIALNSTDLKKNKDKLSINSTNEHTDLQPVNKRRTADTAKKQCIHILQQ